MVIPILMFIVIVAIAFEADVSTGNFWGADGYSFTSLWDQATGTILITFWNLLLDTGVRYSSASV